jgi:hypothetical protein
LAGFSDWFGHLDMVDGTLIGTGVCLTVLGVVFFIKEACRDTVKWFQKSEKRRKRAAFWNGVGNVVLPWRWFGKKP